MTTRQINYWTTLGLIHPAGGRPGPGRQLFWSDEEWRVVQLAGRLVAEGLRPERAVQVARRAQLTTRVELAPGLILVVSPEYGRPPA